VTGGVYTGNLGGVAGADAKCQARAAAAGLSGVFKAWISTATNSPGKDFIRSPAPYVMPNGGVVAMSWPDLVSGVLHQGISLTETETVFGGPGVWTGTTPQGVSSSPDCVGWTSALDSGTYGQASSYNQVWTIGNTSGCAALLGLYCFEQ
jgi:hypothetical protein